MRVAAVTRVLNEDDIIEAFVRHTAAFADHMLLLDNGSSDRTMEILAALRGEGAPITVVQSRSPIHCEIPVNTLLYHTANQAFQPDWVLHLDADEFVDARAASLRARLEAVPAEMQAVKLPLRNYFAEGVDQAELLTPRRMVLRDAADPGVSKVMLRGGLPPELTVGGGNHDAWNGPAPVPALMLADVPLAHFPERHPVQTVLKAALGRLKVQAAGGGPEMVRDINRHYTPVLEALCRDPAALFHDPARMGGALPPLPLVADPIQYAGGPLRYTTAADPVMKAVRALANAVEALAASHGALLDADPAARTRLEEAALRAELVIR